MRPRAVRRLAWALWLVALGLLVAGLAIAAPHAAPSEVLVDVLAFGAVGALLFGPVGAFLAARRPRNPVGWLLAGYGVLLAFLWFTVAYVGELFDFRLRSPGTLPGADWVAWAFAVVWHPGYGLLFLLLILFPHGRLPSPRWRPLAFTGAVFYAVLALCAAVSPAVTRDYFASARPVLRLPGAALAGPLFETILAGNFLLLAVAMASLLVRLRRARGEERQQVKWFVYSVTVALAAVLLGFLVLSGGYLVPLLGAIPVSAAVAIQRYRLYDIDRIINRTVVYGLLTVLLGLGYAGAVLLLGQLLGQGSSLAVAGATLAVAGVFQPARRRVQQAVDRRFDRRRYDAGRTIQAFSARLRDEVDLDSLTAELLAVVEQTMQPTQASLWLRPPGRPAGPTSSAFSRLHG
jgi:MFS family permease